MCCFWPSVNFVGATKIFARLTSTGSQLLAYEMEYKSDAPTAMILPIPVKQPAGDDAVRFIDVSEHREFFSDLEEGFPAIDNGPGFGCAAFHVSYGKAASALPVIEVGSFVASFVPTKADFTRLDERFRFPETVWKSLARYDDFGFAVFQLREGDHKPHPMAFEFPSRLSHVFFPTVHVHDGKVHDTEEFDHLLYTQHAMFDLAASKEYRGPTFQQSLTGLIRSQTKASAFPGIAATKGLIDGDLLVHRRVMKGVFKIEDVEIGIPDESSIRSHKWFSLLNYAPYAAIAGLGAWIVGRRMRLKRGTSSS